MSETQNIEYKSNWREEYLKWICGFANAYGSKIFIGKDDVGNVICKLPHSTTTQKPINLHCKQFLKMEFIRNAVGFSIPYTTAISTIRGTLLFCRTSRFRFGKCGLPARW